MGLVLVLVLVLVAPLALALMLCVCFVLLIRAFSGGIAHLCGICDIILTS
jgi:hypothetical protein